MPLFSIPMCISFLLSYADSPVSGQLLRALNKDDISKFDERVQEESLNMANIEHLVRCPGCNYAAEIIDNEQQVL